MAFQLPPSQYLLMAAAFPRLALAGCDDTEFDPHEVINVVGETGDTGGPGYDRPTRQLPPIDVSEYWAANFSGPPPSSGSCDGGPDTRASWCARSYAYVPADYDEQTTPLFLFLHGAGNRPRQHRHLLHTAAFAGFPAIAPAWDAINPANTGVLTRREWCSHVENNSMSQPVNIDGGWCSDDCTYDVGVEMLTGQDLGTPYDPAPIRSLHHRIALFLHDLHSLDLADDAHVDHDWLQWCDYDPVAGETTIRWEDIVVAGFSEGGNMAGFISFTHDTPGLMMIEAGTDLCTQGTVDDPELVVADFYDELDDTGGCGASDCGNRMIFYHQDYVWSVAKYAVEVLDPLGFYDLGDTGTPEADAIDLDGYLEPTLPVGFDTQPANIYTTDYVTTAPHGSMAVDEDMRRSSSGLAAYVHPLDDPYELLDVYLVPAYLEAVCSLH